MGILKLIVASLTIIAIIAYTSFIYHNKTLIEQNENTQTFIEYINRGKIPPFNTLKIGLIFGIIFGFIDNIGLWFGLQTFEKYIPGGILTKSAVGNTYSNLMGAICGGLISSVFKDKYDYDEDNAPIWLDAVGVVIGCIIGIFVGKLLTGLK